MDRIDCAVVGAGAVGLAVARALARAGRDVVVIERHGAIGTETSSRNSEVIHAGLYHAPGSRKARLCVAGRELLYRHCAAHGIAHRRCGKMIVATDDTQAGQLAALAAQARANGCGDVDMLDADAAQRLEPALRCVAALHSPATGILDSHGYLLSLHGDAERAGAAVAFDSRVIGGRTCADGIVLRIVAGDLPPSEVLAATVVNCAGLGAIALAHAIDGLDTAGLPQARFAKGSYFALSGPSPFSRLIYPMPEPGGLGVHLTLDLAGRARFGPDVEWLETDDAATADYRVDPARAAGFAGAIRRYWPGLPDGALQPAYAGIRPKISGPGEPAADFLFASHGTRRYLGLYGIESPGLTASLAIADHVREQLAS